MTLTDNEQRFFLWLAIAFLAAAVWLFQQFVGYVKNIATSVSKMEKDLSILTNDHSNLKEIVGDHENRIRKVETA